MILQSKFIRKANILLNFILQEKLVDSSQTIVIVNKKKDIEIINSTLNSRSIKNTVCHLGMGITERFLSFSKFSEEKFGILIVSKLLSNSLEYFDFKNINLIFYDSAKTQNEILQRGFLQESLKGKYSMHFVDEKYIPLYGKVQRFVENNLNFEIIPIKNIKEEYSPGINLSSEETNI